MEHKHFRIKSVQEGTQEQAKQIVLEGLEEHFGYLDTSLNPDLSPIVDHYLNKGYPFLVGFVGEEAVCTGALLSIDETTGRIVRMSVKKPYRRCGFASRMIEELEQIAKRKGHSDIFLKTIHHWSDAVSFYTSRGYRVSERTGESVKMVKRLWEGESIQ